MPSVILGESPSSLTSLGSSKQNVSQKSEVGGSNPPQGIVFRFKRLKGLPTLFDVAENYNEERNFLA